MIELSESELATLIEESVGDRMLGIRFGPRFAMLEDTPANAWAVKRVLEMRQDGGAEG